MSSCPRSGPSQATAAACGGACTGLATRPQQWERFAAAALEALGCKRGRASAVCFHHPVRDSRGLVHGGDLVFCGTDADMDWIAKDVSNNIMLKAMGKPGGDVGGWGHSRGPVLEPE